MTLISESPNSPSWNTIFEQYEIDRHDFDDAPYRITSREIGIACQDFQHPSQKEAHVLCKQDIRDSRPRAFRERGLFILPIRSRHYVIVKGEGYVDVPPIESSLLDYSSEFPFELETLSTGDADLQHIDSAHAWGLIQHFLGDNSLVLTIRDEKYTTTFNFVIGKFQISVNGLQTQVDAGYEGAEQVVLVKAKSGNATNTIIRQLYYPFRQWQQHTTKPVSTLFFQRTGDDEYHIWHFGFDDPNDYNSIRLLKSARYRIVLPYR